jgi:cell division protein FtsI/penicillin-binding protein 2
LKQPHLVDPATIRKIGLQAKDIRAEEYPIHESTVDIVTKAMWGVVNEAGTGFRAKIEGFDVAGKTGTAQVVSLKAKLKGQEYKDNAWFVGFAPYRNPEIVVAAFIENGGWGGEAAAPVAHAIMETYYKKKTGQFTDQITTIAQK